MNLAPKSAGSLHSLIYVTDETESASTFFQAALGMDFRFADGTKWIQLSASGTAIALAEPSEGFGKTGMILPVFRAEDLDTASTQIVRNGGDQVALRNMGSHGRTALMRSPEGHLFCLYASA